MINKSLKSKRALILFGNERKQMRHNDTRHSLKEYFRYPSPTEPSCPGLPTSSCKESIDGVMDHPPFGKLVQ
ncbi:hypothetical protein TNCV_3888061 [Trichonephila clavipes]|nr:hypothetical protein TNCV_3888061 [Trichonephila clavipes]